MTDKGVLTLGDNRKVDFSQCMIFMTSNLGASELEALGGPGVGFAASGADMYSDRVRNRAESIGIRAARKRFSPEFINRIDKTIVFRALRDEELERVLDLELKRVHRMTLSSTPFLFTLTAAARRLLIEAGTDARYGARHLKRAMNRLLVQPLANLVASEQVRTGDRVEVDCDGASLQFARTDEGLTVHQIYRAAGLPPTFDPAFFDQHADDQAVYEGLAPRPRTVAG